MVLDLEAKLPSISLSFPSFFSTESRHGGYHYSKGSQTRSTFKMCQNNANIIEQNVKNELNLIVLLMA